MEFKYVVLIMLISYSFGFYAGYKSGFIDGIHNGFGQAIREMNNEIIERQEK